MSEYWIVLPWDHNNMDVSYRYVIVESKEGNADADCLQCFNRQQEAFCMCSLEEVADSICEYLNGLYPSGLPFDVKKPGCYWEYNQRHHIVTRMCKTPKGKAFTEDLDEFLTSIGVPRTDE